MDKIRAALCSMEWGSIEAEDQYNDLLAYVGRLEEKCTSDGGVRYRNIERVRSFLEAPEFLQTDAVSLPQTEGGE